MYPAVDDGGERHGCTCSDCFWPVTESSPVDLECRDVMVMKFTNHQMSLNGIKGRTEVNEEKSGEVGRCFKM